MAREHVRAHIRSGRPVRSYWRNRSEGKNNSGIVVGAIALVAAVTIGGTGFVGVGASGASLPSLSDISINKDSAKGNSKGSSESWERKGIKYVERAARSEASCVVASHGHVQRFLAQIPCRSLRRYILAAGNVRSGDTAVVSLVKVKMYDKAQAAEFKRLLDRPASGDIWPLGASILREAGITFTGLHYASKLDGSTVVAAEAEPDGGPSTAASLRKMATDALGAPFK